MTNRVIPFSLKDAPALIERILPVQRLSAEVYKERMAGTGQVLTALGNYWKGRKPLILAKACVLSCLLPVTDEPIRDLAIFEKLMAMDDESIAFRWKRRPNPKDILAAISVARIDDYFSADPTDVLPTSAPVDWTKPEYEGLNIVWRKDISEMDRRRLEAQMLPKVPYRELVLQARRPDEVRNGINDHIWNSVNDHLGTRASSMQELVEQLGVMRYGHRPRFADTFCGSGQIPFEAARLGCDVYASDLNPVAAMLTWGALNIVGGSEKRRKSLLDQQQEVVQKVSYEIDQLGVETDDEGRRVRATVYCMEVRCPETGWMVPLLPSRMLSADYSVVAELVPNPERKRYEIAVRSGVSDEDLKAAQQGTIGRDSRFGDAYLTHTLDGVLHKTKISTIRGDYQKPDGTTSNRLRPWEKEDFRPRQDDILQERLYAVLWRRPLRTGTREELEFCEVTSADMARERVVEQFMVENLAKWQAAGWSPEMRIEPGSPPRYQGLSLIRGCGWTHWHHLFNPRQLLVAGLIRKALTGQSSLGFCQALNYNSRLSVWLGAKTRGYGNTVGTFSNQALNSLFNYGCRASSGLVGFLSGDYSSFPLDERLRLEVRGGPADALDQENDIYVTDPPYGDAVKYEEILDFFIAWMRKSPPIEFKDWTWDSRRPLAIAGEGEDFRRKMVVAYKGMTERMPDNGIQVIMFTHQSGAIWADMANIVWASGLQVNAAWYVVTETDSATRVGSYVKGTVLLACRKRHGTLKTTRDDLAWEIQEEVENQVQALTGLNQEAKGLYRDENVFGDADIQMAGYAAALRVLTRYAIIDGRDMTAEAIRPRVKGETTFVDGLMDSLWTRPTNA